MIVFSSVSTKATLAFTPSTYLRGKPVEPSAEIDASRIFPRMCAFMTIVQPALVPPAPDGGILAT
jgi:hypothetical protein